MRTLETLKRNHPEWSSASELDKKDIMVGLQQQAIKSLDMLPCNRIATFPVLPLFYDEPKDVTIDDALIDRYGFKLISFYLENSDNLEKVYKIPPNHRNRKNFKSLVEVGLAIRGVNIPIENLLSTLKLKDMNEIIQETNVKKFVRKAQAIEYLSKQPNIIDQLSKILSFRELFQLSSLPDDFSTINLDAIAQSWNHSRAIAEIITNTYESGLNYIKEKENIRDYRPGIKGWKIHLNENAPLYCQKVADRASSAKRLPKLPAHIGCNCRAYPVWDD
jgi:hypothetical protein